MKNNRLHKKNIITIAPVYHIGKVIPYECKNPLSPDEIAEDVLSYALAGTGMVHLHVRDEAGEQTSD